MSIYTCQKVVVRNGNKIDYRGEQDDVLFSYKLSEFALEFVKKAGNNVRAFVVDEKEKPKLLLLYNIETKDIYLPEEYLKEEQVKIRQKFIQFLLKNPNVTYVSSEI